MGNEIATLFARVGADTTGLEKGLAGVKTAMVGSSSDMLTMGDRLAGGLKAGLGVAFGIAAAGAGVLATGLGLAVKEAMDAQANMAQLDAVLKSTGAAAQQQADAWAAAQGKTISVNKMSGEALSELQDKLQGATARLNDLQFSWDHAKTKTETAERSLNKARETVASLQQQIADGSGTIQVGLAGALGLVPPVARMTRDELLNLADSLQKITPVSDDAVIAGEAMLLTFTQIGKDTFPDATRALLDMATAMNSGAAPSAEQLKSQAIQLGKALNSPAEGLSALTRVGVTFTEAQKAQVKAMVAAGDVAGAQRVILKELQTEFGGSAKAAGQTLGGQLTILKNRLLNVAEGIGTSALPSLQKFLENGIMPLVSPVEKMGEAFGNTFGAILENGRDPLTAITGALSAAFYAIAEGNPRVLALSEFFQTVSNKVYGAVQTVEKFITTFQTTLAATDDPLKAFAAAFGGLWEEVQPKLSQFVTNAVEWVKTQVPVWGENLKTWGQAFGAWVSDNWPVLLANLELLANSVRTWIVQQVQPLKDKIAEWSPALSAWINGNWPVVRANLELWMNSLHTWFAQNALPLTEQIKKDWAPAALAWLNVASSDVSFQAGLMTGKITGWMLTDGIKQLGEVSGKLIVALFTPVPNSPGDPIVLGNTVVDSFLVGFAAGISRNMPDILTNVDKAFTEIGAQMNTDMNIRVAEIFTLIATHYPDMVEIGKIFLGSFWDGIKLKFIEINNWFDEKLKELNRKLKDMMGFSGIDTDFTRGSAWGPNGGIIPHERASGGPVIMGRPYIVGERGPELFVPGQSGNIYNNQQTSWNINLTAINGYDSLAQMQAQAGAW